jgi:hypothetical protein
MAKKRKAKKSKVKRTKAKKTKVKRKRTAKNKPERHPNQGAGTPEATANTKSYEIGHAPKPKLIMDHLAQTEVHVEQGANHVKRQRQLLEDLARDGHDTTGPSALLNLFKELHDLHVQDRDRLRAELADVKKQLLGIDQHKGLA